MRRLFYCFACIAALGAAGAAAADEDPPHKHYSVSHIPPDPDLNTAPKVGHFRAVMRPKVDLTRSMPPVGDQGELGSGVAWAVAYAARSYYVGRNEKRDIERPDNEASPGYVFHLARKGDCAEGANLTEAVDVLRNGALSLAAYPYRPSCEPPAPAREVARARDFRVRGYRVVDNGQIDDLKGQIERGNPVITLFRVTSAFTEFRGSGIFKDNESTNVPSSGEDEWQPLVIVGYDDQKQAVRAMNSWGRGWGDQGFTWISYADLATRSRGSIVLDVATASGLDSKPTGLGDH